MEPFLILEKHVDGFRVKIFLLYPQFWFFGTIAPVIKTCSSKIFKCDVLHVVPHIPTKLVTYVGRICIFLFRDLGSNPGEGIDSELPKKQQKRSPSMEEFWDADEIGNFTQ